MKYKYWKIGVIGLIFIISIGFTIGFIWGYSKGSYDSTIWGIKVAKAFIGKDVISINEDVLAKGIMQYKERVGGCLFIENASIFDDEGNIQQNAGLG